MTSNRSPASLLLENYVKACFPFRSDVAYAERRNKLAVKLQNILPHLSGEEKFYCYVYLDPQYPGEYEYTLPSGQVVKFSYRPFYVGKGQGIRHTAHLRGAIQNLEDPLRSHQNKHKLNTLRKILRQGMSPIIKRTPSRVRESLALAFEADLIAGIGRRNVKTGPLTNLTNGGEGSSGAIVSDSTKAKMSRSAKARPPISDETREKISMARIGFVPTKATREKIGQAHKGKYVSDETRKRMSLAQKGKPKDAKVVARMKASLQGRVKTESHLANISAARASKTPEERAEIGRKHWETRRANQKARNSVQEKPRRRSSSCHV